MSDARIQVPDKVRRKALALGEAGVAWLAGLDGLARDLAAEFLAVADAWAEAETTDARG